MTDFDETDGQKSAAQIMWGRLTQPEREATMAHLLAHTAVTGTVIWEAIEAGIKVASERAHLAAQNGGGTTEDTGPRRRRRTKAEMQAVRAHADVSAPVTEAPTPPPPNPFVSKPDTPFIGAMHR